jgi:DNA-nicking Smr family endonuclease
MVEAVARSRHSNSDERDAGSDPVEAEAPVVLPIEDVLDLHSFAPRDIPHVVREYLSECARRGFREVRIIHGRGTGTQRAVVRSLLTGHPLVETFDDAPPARGGWGATVVRLREDPNTMHDDQ